MEKQIELILIQLDSILFNQVKMLGELEQLKEIKKEKELELEKDRLLCKNCHTKMIDNRISKKKEFEKSGKWPTWPDFKCGDTFRAIPGCGLAAWKSEDREPFWSDTLREDKKESFV